MERHREWLITRMQAKGIAPQFAERVFEQIKGFGEYGFPESHAASFALIAYATAWLKCYYPAEFVCSLLNAQPMGFYTAATIVEDAKRHNLVVAPIDVTVSDWDCTLEPSNQSVGGFAVRMGFRYVKGFRENDWERIEHARRQAPFATLEDFVQRSGLEERVLSTLAEAGAFEGFGVERRTALWDIKRLSRTRYESLSLKDRERSPHFDFLTDFEEVKWDYRTTSHSPRRHPLEPVRANLADQGLPDARTVASMKDGDHVRYAGLSHRPAASWNRCRRSVHDSGR
jgi:error-prone DNA polymerase